MSRVIGSAALFAVAVLVLLFVTLPVSIQTQFCVGLSFLAAMLVLYRWRPRGAGKHIFLALGTMLIGRYVYWRLTSTLPSVENLSDFIPAIVLLLAETFCILMMAMSLFVNSDPIDRDRAPQQRDGDLPTVDVFVPSYNEDAQLVGATLAAARAMDYPRDKLNIYLLDDGGTDEKCEDEDYEKAERAQARRRIMQELCEKLGVHYLTRERNVSAKAGNLNNGLQNTTGELVVVFDADHAPAREFLRETVGYFSGNDRLFLVQTPHFFLNPDPIERNLSTFRSMPSENEMFYAAIQKGLDKWNSAFFCGSAAVLRRSALDEVGGFSGMSITEDAETALELHARGWESLYVDRPMIAGLQPETFASFMGQRSRWCAGMMQIFTMKNPLFKRGLTFAQRVCYLSSSMFWLFPLPRFVFLMAPLLYIFFDAQIYIASQQEFIAYTAMYMIAGMMIQSYLFGNVRWPWVSELYEYVQSVYLVRPLLGVFVNPRRPKFNVTAKGDTLAHDQLSSLSWPFFVIFGVLAAAEIMVGYRYQTEPAARDLLAVIAIWNTFNLVLSAVALGVVSERRERRETPRVDVQKPAVLTIGTVETAIVIEDISLGGIRVRAAEGKIAAPAGVRLGTVTLPLGGHELNVPVALAGLRTGHGGRTQGLRFYGLNADRLALVGQLLYGDITLLRRERLERRKPVGIVMGSARFIGWSLRECGRGMSFALFRRRANAEPSTGEGRAEAPARST